MNNIDACFLNILRHALKGEAYSAPLTLDAAESARLFSLAQSHHVLPLLYEAVHRQLPDSGIKNQVRTQVLIQAQKTYEFTELYENLCKNGIRPIVVKGIVCRSLYPNPDHRLSADEDLLIEGSQVDACRDLFISGGLFTDVPDTGFADEIPYRSKNGMLYIELHRHLFPTESAAYGDLNRFFENAFSRSIDVDIGGVKIRTLCHTDHLFYLICHAFKHFLHSGFGIRQVCDTVMYANAHFSAINWDELYRSCKAIRADRFASAMLEIGRVHLGIDINAPYFEAVSADAMLDDLLSGGIYGYSSEERLHSSNITLDAVASSKQKRRSRGVLSSLFPSPKSLIGNYPYLKKRPYLVPLAWTHRIFRYLLKGGNATAAVRTGNDRVALLKHYGIID